MVKNLRDRWHRLIGSATSVAAAQDSLADTRDNLKHLLDRGEDPRRAFQVCLSADDSHCRAHVIYREIGEVAISAQQWQFAEQFAIRSLKALPRYGAAFKLLGLSLRGQERYDEAALCHRYNLPNAIREKYFNESPVQSIDSSQASDTVTLLPAFDAEEIELTPPLQIKPVFINELSATTLQVREAQTYQLSRCRIWFDNFNTVVWDQKGRIIKDACRGFFEVVQYATSKQELIKLDGLTCVLGNRNSDNYYHWMNDVLPRLAVLQKSGVNISSIDHFIVSKLKHAYQFETLAAFGIDESRLTYIGKNVYFSCDECVLASYGSNTLGLGQGAWNPAFLKMSFLTNYDNESNKKIYISRADSSTRGIENEACLKIYLKSIGFICIQLESMSVRAQAKLFNSASVILGPHGAGLSNIAFCNPDTTIIELYKDHIAPCFWTISQAMGFRHCVHYCGDQHSNSEAANSESYHITADNRRKSSFSVSVDDIADLLKFLHVD